LARSRRVLCALVGASLLCSACRDRASRAPDGRHPPAGHAEATRHRADAATRADQRSSPPPPPATPERLRAERAEVDRLTEALLDGGISPRQVASICDIRGFRLYGRQRYARARVWFERAVRLDPRFEPALYNAARAAAKVGDIAAARRMLQLLRQLGTPLGRRQLERAATDPDLAQAR